jgi:hypothetical protein
VHSILRSPGTIRKDERVAAGAANADGGLTIGSCGRSHEWGCPILSRFVRKGGQHGPRLIPVSEAPTAWVRGSHPCKERKDGAPFVVMVSKKPNEGRAHFNIEFDREDDGRWIAEIPELPGVMAYGATRNEAEAAVEMLGFREKIRRGIAQLDHSEGISEDKLDAHLKALKAKPE